MSKTDLKAVDFYYLTLKYRNTPYLSPGTKFKKKKTFRFNMLKC